MRKHHDAPKHVGDKCKERLFSRDLCLLFSCYGFTAKCTAI